MLLHHSVIHLLTTHPWVEWNTSSIEKYITILHCIRSLSSLIDGHVETMKGSLVVLKKGLVTTF